MMLMNITVIHFVSVIFSTAISFFFIGYRFDYNDADEYNSNTFRFSNIFNSYFRASIKMTYGRLFSSQV